MADRVTSQPDELQGGLNFRDLLSSAVGKDFESITKEDVRDWATGQGWRKKDVNRITRGFSKFSKRGGDFALTDPGEFDVAGAGPTSGVRTGNVKGFDIGDLLGLGRDVSTLAGALELTRQSPEENSGLANQSIYDYNRELFGGLPEEKAEVYTGQGDGASGQAKSQASAQSKQKSQKDQSPLQNQVSEGAGELAFEFDPVDVNSLMRQPNFSLLNQDQNLFGGNVKLGQGFANQNTQAQPAVEVAEEPEEENFFTRLNRTLNQVNVESAPVNEFRPLVETADRAFGTDFGSTGFGEFISGMGLVPTGAPQGAARPIIEGLKKLGLYSKDIAKGVASIAKKGWKNIRVPNWNEQQALSAMKELMKVEKNLLPKQAESLKSVITTPPPATRVGNVGFGPKVRRFGGKL